jgi:hypothetical protein
MGLPAQRAQMMWLRPCVAVARFQCCVCQLRQRAVCSEATAGRTCPGGIQQQVGGVDGGAWLTPELGECRPLISPHLALRGTAALT